MISVNGYIYKITSPSKKIYVGSTINIKRRWRDYKNLKCKEQKKIYSSFLKYGVEKHLFEIITECDLVDMLKMETHWGLFFNVLDKKAGLNLKLPKDGEIYGGCSSERNTSGDFKKGQVPWNKGLKGVLVAWNKGVNCKESTKQKLSIKKTGLPSKKKGKTYGNIAHNAKLIICLNTGIFYENMKQASEAYSYKRSTLEAMLRGQNKNKSNLIYV